MPSERLASRTFRALHRILYYKVDIHMIDTSLTSVGVQPWKHQNKFTRNTISTQTSIGVPHSKALVFMRDFSRL